MVVFGDHGEGLGDHQETDHGYYIYESTLHVPLIFHWPHTTQTQNSKIETRKSARASSFDFRVSSFNDYVERVEAPVGLIDVAPTILDYLRVPAPASFEGAKPTRRAQGGGVRRAARRLQRKPLRPRRFPLGAAARPARGEVQIHSSTEGGTLRPRCRPARTGEFAAQERRDGGGTPERTGEGAHSLRSLPARHSSRPLAGNAGAA